jgi:hypothetical protein
MTSFVLKLIAITTMLIDHIGAVLIQNGSQTYWICRGIGRLAFPIFVFLIIEGFTHTSNVKKYLTRLGIFAFVSELPYDLVFYRYMFQDDIIEVLQRIFKLISHGQFNSELSSLVTATLDRLMQQQNIFFTLFLGLLLITLMSKIEQKYQKDIFAKNILEAIFVMCFCLIAYSLRTDYHYAGILLIASFYIFRTNKLLMTLSLLAIMAVIFGGVSIYAVFSMIFIVFYNGKKGKNIKYLFYIFYPAHLFLLFLIDIFR